MNLQMTFNHLESTPSLKEKIEHKCEKLKKYFHGDFEVQWMCNIEGDTQSSHIQVVGDGLSINAHSSSNDLYKTFDDVLHKIEKQLLKQKQLRSDHIHHKH